MTELDEKGWASHPSSAIRQFLSNISTDKPFRLTSVRSQAKIPRFSTNSIRFPPTSNTLENPMEQKRKWKISMPFLLLALISVPVCAQSFKVLQTFNGTNGVRPVDTPLVQGIDGEFYGTTLGGGANAAGTIFKISSTGKLTTLYSFCALTNCADGNGPYGGLVLGTDGNFYGTTESGGGSSSDGTVFKMTPSGKLTTLHSFDGTDGFTPLNPLVQGLDGYFYGTTNSDTIFKISPSGVFTSLYSFSGESYSTGPLMQATDGNFYGTTEVGGANFNGTVFKITAGGTFSVLYSFSGTDGDAPASGLVQGSDGALYGVTYSGGTNFNGTIFKITLAGVLTTIHNFDETDGGQPIAAMIKATDGNFYGTTYGGGANGWGTVFEMTPAGAVTTLHSFTGADGAQPYSPVTQSTAGSFYGTATNGTNSAADGTVFGLVTGLGPFVHLLSPVGRVGRTVGILGQGFIGTSSVTIGGISMGFTIQSSNYIAATIPTGATTGYVTVTTSAGILKSNVRLKIVP